MSTRPDAEATGPRAHVVGVTKAFEALGWRVERFIVGDHMPNRIQRDSERLLIRGGLWAFSADTARLALGAFFRVRAVMELRTRVDWVYERFALFQALGGGFQRHGIPWILETNAPLFEEAKTERNSLVLTRLARALELRAYRRCDMIVCVSDALKEIIVRQARIPAEKVLVVPNGVDTSLFDPKRHVPIRIYEDFTIGFVGSLIHWQGLDLLLKAVKTLRVKHGWPLKVVIVGTGPERKRLEELTTELKLHEHVRFLGRVTHGEVPALVAGMDMAYSGHFDARQARVYRSPLKLYEYMAMGRVVVASAVEDAIGLIREGHTGFLFQPGDQHDLIAALERAYAARGNFRQIGEQARADVVARHSWVARVEQIIAGTERLQGKRQ